MLFDLHLHSRYSIDALTKPETIVKVCKNKEIGFSLTDHNNMDAYKGVNGILKIAKKQGVLAIPGEEIKVISQDENKNEKPETIGEVIVYFLATPIKPSSFEEILDQVKKQDALLSCPHPFDWPRKNFKPFTKQWKKFTCMEIYNARAYYQGLNKASQEFYAPLQGKIAPLGVSDAHTPEEIGNGLTKINADTLEGVRKQLKKHKSKVIPRGKARPWHHFKTQLAKRDLISER